MVMERAPFDDAQHRQGLLDALDAVSQAPRAAVVEVDAGRGLALDAFANGVISLYETGQSPSPHVVSDGLQAITAVARGMSGGGGSSWQAETEAIEVVSGAHLRLSDRYGGRRLSVYLDAAGMPFMGVLSVGGDMGSMLGASAGGDAGAALGGSAGRLSAGGDVGSVIGALSGVLSGGDVGSALAGSSSLPSVDPTLMLAFTVVSDPLGARLQVSDGPRDSASAPMAMPPTLWAATPQFSPEVAVGGGGSSWAGLLEAGAAGAAAALAAGAVAGLIDRRSPAREAPAAPVAAAPAWAAPPAPPSPAPDAPPARFCSSCGASRAGVGRFCEQCGTRFSA